MPHEEAKKTENDTRVASTQPQAMVIGIRERRRRHVYSLGKLMERTKHNDHMQTRSFPRIGDSEVDVWNTIEKNESGDERKKG